MRSFMARHGQRWQGATVLARQRMVMTKAVSTSTSEVKTSTAAVQQELDRKYATLKAKKGEWSSLSVDDKIKLLQVRSK